MKMKIDVPFLALKYAVQTFFAFQIGVLKIILEFAKLPKEFKAS